MHTVHTLNILVVRRRYFLLLISFLANCGLASGTAYGQVPEGKGQLPYANDFLYVDLSGRAINNLPLHWVQTQRVSKGQPQQLELLNLLVPRQVVEAQPPQERSSEALLEDELLIAMAILPDKETGRVTWEPVRPDTLAAVRRLSVARLLDDCYARVYAYEIQRTHLYNQLTRRTDVKPLVERDGQVWTTPNVVLTEYFLLRNRPTYWPTAGNNITINVQARPFTRADFRQAGQVSAKDSFPSVEAELGTSLLLEEVRNGIYTFWSLEPLIADGPLRDYGSVDIQFKPGVGLVSGKYNHYFGIPQNSAANTFFKVTRITKLSN